jgi:hypothetical protein
MKAILYVGGALMVAAGIYGFIDYKKSSHDKNFKTLYENKKEVAVPAERKETGTAKEEPAKVAAVKNKELNQNSTVDKKSVVVKKKRKVSLDKFSRAPLDEKYLEEKIKVEPKKEEIKVVRKDSLGEKKEQ